MTNKEILSQFFDSLKDDVIKEHIASGQKATGETIASFETRTNDHRGQLLGPSWSPALEDGTKPGTKPNIGKLIRWIEAKGILTAGSTGKVGMAIAISRKINLEGTVLYRRGGRSGVLTKAINEKRISSLIDILTSKYAAEISSEVIEGFKR